jgi:hypothetical protein
MFKQVVIGPDGTQYASMAEATDALRKPAVLKAMNAATSNNKELTDWLIANEETVQNAFEFSIKRVTKAEHNKLVKCKEELLTLKDSHPRLGFLIDNVDAMVDSFRWPTMKRMTEEEKATASRNTLVAASEGNEELAAWVVTNQAVVLEAYEAGKIKREVSPKATEALAAYQAKKSAEALAAATAAGPEALAAYKKKLEENAAKREAAKAA